MPRTDSHLEKQLSWASSPAIRESMLGNKSRDTKPELIVRRYLHASGLRYRVHTRPIKDWNRRADIVFPRAKIAIFINGCYWHGCYKHYKEPKTNTAYWSQKIKRNVERDSETYARLRKAGWLVIKVWEHEDLNEKASKITGLIRRRLRDY